MTRVGVDGKHFALGGQRFSFRGVTYGTFRPRGDGMRFPERSELKNDVIAVKEAGFTVLRTYTAPPEDLLELAADWYLHLLAGVFFPDWRYLVGASRRDQRRVLREARDEVRSTARRLAGNENVLALCVGNEIPADVVRWVGSDVISSAIDELAEVVREEDGDVLVTYANYPSAEYLPLDSLDFLTFNVFLERQADLRRYLSRLHNIAADRPVVLGEVGWDVGAGPGGEQRQAEAVDWLLGTAIERGMAGTCLFSWTDEWWVGDAAVDGWHFGLTRSDRSPRPALAEAERWNRRTVADLQPTWPGLSVVICAYNAAATIDECLRHTCALDYPDLEVIVVNDGSTDATGAIVAAHPRARLVSIEHAGLSVARNEGYRLAGKELVAYLDSDAYPTPEWPYYLALGLDDPDLGGVGGPNLPPTSDPPGAQQVARAPGGPVQVLLSDDRAEHLPGCNMAFRRSALQGVGGFDPVYESAGDDVDLCWRVLDRGWELGFHPAALVWHHRRAGLRAYLRQQRGYGRAEALVEARHPDRFTGLGTARWRGHIYSPLRGPEGGQRIYRGLYGTAAYQSVYRTGGHALDLAHQVGVPLGAVLVLSAPLVLLDALLGLPALAAVAAIAVLVGVDVARATPPRPLGRGGWRFRLGVATMCVLQPLVRTWGRIRMGGVVGRGLPAIEALPGALRKVSTAVSLLPADRPREELAAAIIAVLRRAGIRVRPVTGWEDHDGQLVGSSLVLGELVTSGHPLGSVQLKVRPRLRWGRLAVLCAAVLALGAAHQVAALVLAAAAGAEAVRGLWRVSSKVHRTLAARAAR